MYIVMSHFSYLHIQIHHLHMAPANKPSSFKKKTSTSNKARTSCRKQDAWQEKAEGWQVQWCLLTNRWRNCWPKCETLRDVCTKNTCNEGTQGEPCFLISGDQAGTGGCCNIQVGFWSVVCIHERKSCKIFPPEYHRPCRFQGIMNGTGVYQSWYSGWSISDLICTSRMVAFIRNVSIMGFSCLTLLEKNNIHRTSSLPINTSSSRFVNKIPASKFRTEQTPPSMVLQKGKEDLEVQLFNKTKDTESNNDKLILGTW